MAARGRAVNGRRFRPSSWGAAAIILALLLLILHRFGTFLLFFLVGAGLLWYGRRQREAGNGDGEKRVAAEQGAAEQGAAEQGAAEQDLAGQVAAEPPAAEQGAAEEGAAEGGAAEPEDGRTR